MTLALVMLVRDEEAVIGRALRSVRERIDHWTIVDTGSSDGTWETATTELKDVPGEWHDRPWHDFGYNYSEALALAKGTADYLLLMDADMEVVWHKPLPELTADAYYLYVYDVRLVQDDYYWAPQLLRSDRDWQFVGATHEYLDYLGSDRLDSLSLAHHCDGSRRPRKFEEDLALLEQAHADDPDDARTVFYLANTLRDLGRYEEAIPLYWQRARMGGFLAEAELAARQAILLEAGDTTAVGVPSPV